jgi:hypothetical protein
MESFLEELMLFLDEEDIVELTEKAGVRFPIVDVSYEDLCYISCWMSMRRKIPDSIHNRMVLGEPNRWVQIYMAAYEERQRTP